MRPPGSWIPEGAVALLLLAHGAAAGPAPGVFRVAEVEVPMRRRAVGTVQSRTEAQLMSQASGRILEVRVREGDAVTAGQELVVIEDLQLALRLAQARGGVAAAEAGRRQAEEGQAAAQAGLEMARAEHQRTKSFLAQNAATPQQMERAEAGFRQAEAQLAQARARVAQATAEVGRAQDGVREVEVLLGYARVRAPLDGVVVARLAEPGDLAWPGRPLLRVQDPSSLQLEAHLREGLAGALVPGQALTVRIDALGVELRGTLRERVPLADPVSRKFTVKVTLPETPGMLPGMFGRLEVPLGVRSALLVPADRVTRVGQLRLVRVQGEAGPERRLIRLGEGFGDMVEVLAGLAPGEQLLEVEP